jgi:hypothetical protein
VLTVSGDCQHHGASLFDLATPRSVQVDSSRFREVETYWSVISFSVLRNKVAVFVCFLLS